MTATALPPPTQLLPHRPPFLFVDELLAVEVEDGVSGHGVWVPPPDAFYFEGYHPGEALVPTSILLEAMAQIAACVAAMDPRFADRTPVLARMDDVVIHGDARPGQRVDLHLLDGKLSTKLGKGTAVARVDGTDLAQVTLTFVVLSQADAPA